jgi:predicted transcriptional regulator
MITLYGVFVNSQKVPYAQMIVDGVKKFETRGKNVLRRLIGHRVAIVETGKGSPVIVGFVTIDSADFFCTDAWEKAGRQLACVPKNSEYDDHGRGKWMYKLIDPFALHTPIKLPANAIRHGRSYCEFFADEL